MINIDKQRNEVLQIGSGQKVLARLFLYEAICPLFFTVHYLLNTVE